MSDESRDSAAPQDGDDTWNLWVVTLGGSTPRRLTDVSDGERLFQPAWTPDDTSILVTSNRARRRRDPSKPRHDPPHFDTHNHDE